MPHRSIGEVMTPAVVTVPSSTPLRRAQAMMQGDRIRHLPVVDDAGVLVGVLNEREVAVLRGVGFGVDDTTTVGDAMASPAYAVAPDTLLLEVVRHLREERCGAAIVVDDGSVVGIFTPIDALAVLEEALQ